MTQMSGAERAARRGGYVPVGTLLTAQQLAWFDELLRDADRSHRPTPWERNFLASMAGLRRRGGGQLHLTAPQMAALARIEEKIHAAG